MGSNRFAGPIINRRKSFYKALVEAKGYKLRTTNRPGSRSSRGRQAEFRTTAVAGPGRSTPYRHWRLPYLE